MSMVYVILLCGIWFGCGYQIGRRNAEHRAYIKRISQLPHPTTPTRGSDE